GSLRFYLTYSSEQQQGHFFYLPYLAWGWLTARVGLPGAVGYHVGRVLAGLFFLWSAHRFLARTLRPGGPLGLAWALAAISSGLGWAALPFGHIAPDLWVPEAISFYSLFTNMHFPLATGLMLWLFLLCVDPGKDWERGRLEARRVALAALCGAGLALALPFATFTVYPVLGASLVWKWWRTRRVPWADMWTVAASAVPVAVVGAYDLAVVASDPLVRAWNAQDVNVSPPLWDVALAYGLVGLLAAWGAWWACRTGQEGAAYLAVWAVVNLVMVYVPLPLQRRLIMGLHVPLCGLAALGAGAWLARLGGAARRRLGAAALVGVTAISNVVVVAIALSGAVAHDRHYFFSRAEAQAMAWLGAHAAPRSVVLAAPSTSLFIPARAGLQVVYGHPLETAYAAQRKGEVERFFAGDMSAEEEVQWLAARRVGYVLWGPAEQALGSGPPEARPYLVPVFQAGEVQVFRVDLAGAGGG
ncbi:MAG: hypothetical protein H5T59_07110, partial [Anaerolineae bacterium]|nr:hypothetical protein [Anaerolineae bacterium]